MISPSINSGEPISAIFWILKRCTRRRRWSGWSRTIVPPRAFWMLPMPWSEIIREERARRSGQATERAGWCCFSSLIRLMRKRSISLMILQENTGKQDAVFRNLRFCTGPMRRRVFWRSGWSWRAFPIMWWAVRISTPAGRSRICSPIWRRSTTGRMMWRWSVSSIFRNGGSARRLFSGCRIMRTQRASVFIMR